jgi:hypothetical protein
MNTINPQHEAFKKPRFINKKEFGQYLGFNNRKTITNYYNNYLFAVGKSPGLMLSTLDLHKIDGVIID